MRVDICCSDASFSEMSGFRNQTGTGNFMGVNDFRMILCCEGPRSRRYGRTAALRLLVQPCDEDDDDDYYFLSFP
jgi:hypothetical protein